MTYSGWVHIEVKRIKRVTDKALLVVIEVDSEDEEVWIPKSQVADADDYEVGDANLCLSVTEWIYRQKFPI